MQMTDIIERTKSTLKESFLGLERVAGNAKLIISEGLVEWFCFMAQGPRKDILN